MKKLFTLCLLAVLVTTANAQNYRRWDLSSWSPATVANLMADSGWSDIEKADGTAPTDLSKDNCFWEVTASGSTTGTTLTANGVVIEELEGLLYTNTTARSLAIAVNYQGPVGTDFGPYHGPSYLWFGSSNKNYFIIPKVQPGTKIKMGLESHKITDARGVRLYLGAGTAGTQLLAPDGSTVEMPKEYVEQEWVVPTDATDTPNADGTYDIQINNSNGCHIYFIEVGDPDQKSKVGYLYEGALEAELAYPIISTNDKFTVEPIAVTETLTLEALTAYDAIVISSTLQNADAIASLKAIQPFVPTLNLNTSLYEAWGYGQVVDGHLFAVTNVPGNALFRDLELITEGMEDGYAAIPLTASMPYQALTLSGYFANDQVLATVMEGEAVAIHAHNMDHNGYIFIPYTQEALADAASPQILVNAVNQLINTKAKVTQAPKPAIELDYKDMNTNVILKSTVKSAQIFYTTDGTEPTTESTLYEEPFNISQEGITVKAAALGDGYLLSDVAELAVDLKHQAPVPAIATAQEEGKTIVTLTTDMEGAQIYYNYSGRAEVAKSSLYEAPIPVTLVGRTLYAFTTAEGYVNSELASQEININNPKVRIDVLAHMDANSEEYYEKSDKRSGSAGYFFSWGRDKAAYPYYVLDSKTEETSEDPDTGDELITVTYTELSPEEEVDFENGWGIRSRGQLVILETLNATDNIGDESSRNPASVEDINPYFPITRNFVNLADKNNTPSDGQGFPYNAYIFTTQKQAGPFDIVANIGNGAGAESRLTIVLQVSTDGNQWDSNWQTVGDTITIVNGQRLYHNIIRSYEGTDEVYVRAYLAANNSKAQFYDIFLANQGEKSEELLSNGIAEQHTVGQARTAAYYSINGARQQGLKRGINIIRYTDGTARKVVVK